ncbi:MAG: GAF domain-containing protein [Actinomycetota bacterium]|nr:GAF domain-containing protein [Actinomycetota bacterium]MDQ2956336.1 GAF domain-containing protein [Actinomycetota bacterium]
MNKDPNHRSNSVATSFLGALSKLTDPQLFGPDLLPTRLAIAAAEVLAVEAAGISVIADIRVPLGASSADACTAERLQFTAGEGPCLSAVAAIDTQVASENEIARRWPAFYDGFVTKTPFRSVASVPLFSQGSQLGAVDFYGTKPDSVGDLLLDDAELVAEYITLFLLQTPFTSDSERDVAQPAWLDAPAAQHRMDVWKAIGLISVAQLLTAPDALSVIRGFAYSHDESVDEVSDKLMSGALTAESFAS